MSNEWTEVKVTGALSDKEDICAVMSMLDNGLMIEDYSDFSFNGMYGELVDETIKKADRETVKVSLFVPAEKPLSDYLSFLKERFAALGISVGIECVGLCEDDWAESWKQYYKPVPLGRVTIVPAWEKYEAKAGEVVVRMDPGMAFGTGTHETTRLVVILLQDLELAEKKVLDVGTGSGILSICASKLGAGSCYAYDIDPVAVRVARENAREDGCDNITVGVSDLLAGVDRAAAPFDLCVANIVADIILRMMPDIGGLLKKDAPLILSGIIEPRADEIRSILPKYGFRIEKEAKENDWVAILARKN